MSTLAFSAAAAFLGLAAHPFTTYPLSLAVIRRLQGTQPVKPRLRAAPFSFALLTAAHNEASVIGDKILNLKAVLDRAPGPAEALIYVDGSNDRTADILRDQTDPRFTVVIGHRRGGKTAGLNRLISLTTSDVLVLSDANVMLGPDALERLQPYFADPAVGLVCGHLRYTNGSEGETASNGDAYWRLEEAIRQLESDTGSAIGADGSLYAVRRALWPSVPADLIDDFYVPMRVRLAGGRVIRAADVMAYERSADDPSDEFRRKVRIACQAFNVHRALRPDLKQLPALDRYKYASHKLLKWLIGPNLGLGVLAALIGIAVTHSLVLAGALASGTGLLLMLGRRLGLGPFPSLWNALAMFGAVALGVLRSLQGERFRTWQPAASVRAGLAFGRHPGGTA